MKPCCWLCPGEGLTARFTRLVNPMQAMTMMLTGILGIVVQTFFVGRVVASWQRAGVLERRAVLVGGQIDESDRAVRDRRRLRLHDIRH